MTNAGEAPDRTGAKARAVDVWSASPAGTSYVGTTVTGDPTEFATARRRRSEYEVGWIRKLVAEDLPALPGTSRIWRRVPDAFLDWLGRRSGSYVGVSARKAGHLRT